MLACCAPVPRQLQRHQQARDVLEGRRPCAHILRAAAAQQAQPLAGIDHLPQRSTFVLPFLRCRTTSHPQFPGVEKLLALYSVAHGSDLAVEI